MNVFMVYYRDANSWTSSNQLPKAIFLDEDEAIEYAKKQPGYGYGTDWFVEPVPFNPEA